MSLPGNSKESVNQQFCYINSKAFNLRFGFMVYLDAGKIQIIYPPFTNSICSRTVSDEFKFHTGKFDSILLNFNFYINADPKPKYM